MGFLVESNQQPSDYKPRALTATKDSVRVADGDWLLEASAKIAASFDSTHSVSLSV